MAGVRRPSQRLPPARTGRRLRRRSQVDRGAACTGRAGAGRRRRGASATGRRRRRRTPGRRGVVAADGDLAEHALDVADTVRDAATEMGRTPPQVAIAWTLLNPAVTAPIIGARTPARLEDNLGALEVTFTDDQRAALEKVGEIELGQLPIPRSVLFGGARIESRA
ncbi:aldo/keto reductase [Actinomadura keratinilytica]|uniref:aldo/keto reductase n=1 Tax=Actinomadura keratinilytica TaxID=547461 RepID=UPI0031E9734D